MAELSERDMNCCMGVIVVFSFLGIVGGLGGMIVGFIIGLLFSGPIGLIISWIIGVVEHRRR
jgi:hypothetical protein